MEKSEINTRVMEILGINKRCMDCCKRDICSHSKRKDGYCEKCEYFDKGYEQGLRDCNKALKRDCSGFCNHDDDDINNLCDICNRFCFPIGCMVGEE